MRVPRDDQGADTPRGIEEYLVHVGERFSVISGATGHARCSPAPFLIVQTISATLAQQVRQIGVMKAVGTGSLQITAMYLGMVLAFGPSCRRSFR